jgi:hypothetical protein
MAKVVKLKGLAPKDVPAVLKPDFYFDFKRHPFAHQKLFEADDVNSVVDAVTKIRSYCEAWLDNTITAKSASAKRLGITGPAIGACNVYAEDGVLFQPAAVIPGETPGRIYLERGARAVGASFYVEAGDIYIGANTVIEPGVGIKGPCIIGPACEIRQGAYFRGSIITGKGGTYRGEFKNVLLMDGTNFPHPGYVGDSLCGYETHFGNQATTANLGIYYLVGGKDNIMVNIDGTKIDLGVYKLGVILGDQSQVGCNSVSDPGTFLGPRTIVYQLSRINKGFYGPDEVLKNKPIEHGIVERSSFRPFGG